jgi:hypothetical protein
MTVFYSPGTGYFYDPDDVCEFDAEERDVLLSQLSHGKCLVCGPDSLPILMDAPEQSPDELAEVERYWRSVQLTATDGMVTRHRDEMEEGSPTTLTPERYTELQTYRRALRNWPESGEFPLIEHRPTAPGWLSTLPR